MDSVPTSNEEQQSTLGALEEGRRDKTEDESLPLLLSSAQNLANETEALVVRKESQLSEDHYDGEAQPTQIKSGSDSLEVKSNAKQNSCCKNLGKMNRNS